MADSERRYTWNLDCPICGRSVEVDITRQAGHTEKTMMLPLHKPLRNVNACSGMRVVVSLVLEHCKRCEAPIHVHPSGLCEQCYQVADHTLRTDASNGA